MTGRVFALALTLATVAAGVAGVALGIGLVAAAERARAVLGDPIDWEGCDGE